MSDEPSITSWIVNILEGGVAFLTASIAGVAGFIGIQVFNQASKLAAIQQSINSIETTTARLHAENLVWRDDILRNIELLHSQINGTPSRLDLARLETKLDIALIRYNTQSSRGDNQNASE